MPSIHTLIDTPIAAVHRTAADLVEVRFKPDHKFTVAGIAAILDAREELGKDGPYRVLVVLPEEVDFEMSMITTDHYSGRPVIDHSRAVAWVVWNDSNERFTRLYFTYFPSPVPAEIFYTEAEARVWLEGRKP